MAPTAGWYDDPRDGDKLRYWDGTAWSEHVTTKQQAPADASMPVFPGAAEAQQQNWQYGQPSAQQQQPQQQPPPPPQPGPQQPPPQPQSWQQQQQPWGQQQEQQPWPPQQQWQQPWPPAPAHPPGGVWTSDGAQVTTWGKRFAARLLDVIFVFFGSLPFVGYFLYRTFQALSDQMDNGTYDAFSPSADVVKWEMITIGIFMVVGFAYEVFCLGRWGATPGKRTLDIRVRAWDHEGKLPWSTVVVRVGFVYGLAALSLVPVVGVLAIIAFLLDGLWPLWDKRRQALHDKVAKTAVIEGWRSGRP